MIVPCHAMPCTQSYEIHPCVISHGLFIVLKISEKIGGLMQQRNEKINLITQTESAIGLLNLRDVCIYGTDLERPFNLQAIIFGSDDFLVSIGGTRTKDALELLYARQSVVVHAKAYGLQAIDLVDINYKGNHISNFLSVLLFFFSFFSLSSFYSSYVNQVFLFKPFTSVA